MFQIARFTPPADNIALFRSQKAHGHNSCLYMWRNDTVVDHPLYIASVSLLSSCALLVRINA